MEASEFLKEFESENRHKDLLTLYTLMNDITKAEAKIWHGQIIGFGTYSYQNKTTSGEWFLTGFSPRKNKISIYIMSGFENHKTLMEKLGKYNTGKSCLYVKRLEDIDIGILKNLISESIKFINHEK